MANKVERAVLAILGLIVLSIIVWAYQNGAFQFVLDNPGDFIHLFKQHLLMVGLSSLLAILTAIPLAILITRPRFRKLEWLIMNAANLGQTVPSIAVLALLMSYLGLGYWPAVFGLWIYSILPILRNTVAGIDSVNPSILDAGKGMGMKESQILWKLELPNALYPILGGIRTAIVINVGTATLAFLIGGGGLGDLIFTGIFLRDTGLMLAGAIPITLLAVIIDFLLIRFEKYIVPKGLQRSIETV